MAIRLSRNQAKRFRYVCYPEGQRYKDSYFLIFRIIAERQSQSSLFLTFATSPIFIRL